MKNRKTLKTMMLFSVIFAGGISLASCNNGDKTSEEDFIFELTGNGEIAGVNYNFDLKGVEADNEFYISVRDTEIENIWGEWKFVDGKGYILTFDDAYWTEKKVKYNEENNQFYFTYDVNLGSAIGKTSVKFIGDAKDFKYDGEGWGFEPFEFKVVGADVLGMTTLDASLTCYEDLTFKTTASCPLIAVPERNGTYSFDEANNQYSFKFSDEENPTLSTYDEAKNEYKISVVFSVGMPIPFELTYIPE